MKKRHSSLRSSEGGKEILSNNAEVLKLKPKSYMSRGKKINQVKPLLVTSFK